MSSADIDVEENVQLPGFEGPEKVLEIDFVPGVGPERGLREITREQWDTILKDARCTILNTMSNEHLDSYVLSESSLFVYPLKMVLKTCGTTTLLRALETFLPVTQELGMRPEWVSYTRKNFLFPTFQKFPHRDPQEEATYLKKLFPEGNAFILGPITEDHWFVFVADYVDRPTEQCTDRTIDMMMFGIDEEVAKLFFKDRERFPNDEDVTRASGIDTLLPGSLIQEFCFEPCGYSMNGLLYDSYWTIHITPESHCSYASFETNIRMSNYTALIRAVIAIFRPKKYTLTLFADAHAVQTAKELPFQPVVSIPVIQSSERSLLGPCVVSVDAMGQSLISYPSTPVPAARSTSTASSATPRSPRASIACTEAFSPVSTLSASGVPLPPPITTEGLKRVTSVASINGTPTSRTARNYVLSAKSQNEFVGDYMCFLGNYKLLSTGTPISGSTGDLVSLQEAASAALSTPRGKYLVEKRVKDLVAARGTRLRTESF